MYIVLQTFFLFFTICFSALPANVPSHISARSRPLCAARKQTAPQHFRQIRATLWRKLLIIRTDAITAAVSKLVLYDSFTGGKVSFFDLKVCEYVTVFNNDEHRFVIIVRQLQI